MSRPCTVLLTCHDLAHRGGVPLYTRDVATWLRDAGWTTIVYSPTLGPAAVMLREEEIRVVDDLGCIDTPPDLIHGQHHIPAMAAMLRFPRVPALFVCHGVLPWQEAPPVFPTLREYIAVDSLRRDRLVNDHGIAADRVSIVHNFVDTNRFGMRSPLPARPRRALLFSNQAARGDLWVQSIAAACRSRDLSVELAGVRSSRILQRPEDVLGSYDLVFARGRSALEAMAVGAAVILSDIEGFGPLVTSANFDELRDLNFGIGALHHPPDSLASSIDAYDPLDAALVQERVRRDANRSHAMEALLQVYERAMTAIYTTQEHDVACMTAAGHYLNWLAPFVDRTIKETEARVGFDVERLAGQLAFLHRTPLFRLRELLIRTPGLLPLYRRLRRGTREPRSSNERRQRPDS